MKKLLLIGIMLSSIVLLTTPSLPAMQFSLVQDSYTSFIEDTIQKKTLDNLMISENNPIYGSIQSILSTILKQLQQGSLSFLKQKPMMDPDDPQPQFFPFLGIFIYLFIAYVIFKIIGLILQYFGSIIAGIISSIVGRIKNLFTAIISLITALISVIVTILIAVFNVLAKVGEFILNAIVLILSGILSTILVIISGFIQLLGFIWQGFGAFLGVLLDILRIIYEAIFPGSITS